MSWVNKYNTKCPDGFEWNMLEEKCVPSKSGKFEVDAYFNEGKGRAYYDPNNRIINLFEGSGSRIINHEKAHAEQDRNGELSAFKYIPANKGVQELNEYQNYNNRRDEDITNITNDFVGSGNKILNSNRYDFNQFNPKAGNPIPHDLWTKDLNLVSPEFKKWKAEQMIYAIPGTAEYEAEQMAIRNEQARIQSTNVNINFRQEGGWIDKYKSGGLTQSQYLKQRGLKDANNKGDFDNISPNQAREILHDKKINGKTLTPEQNRLFGFLSKGNTLKYQLGGTPYIDSVFNANKNLDWVKRLYQKNTPTIQIPGQSYPSSHMMESSDGNVYPRIVNIKGKLVNLGDRAWKYAQETGTSIKFPNDSIAQKFGETYKQGTGVLKPMHKMGGSISELGYSDGSPYRNSSQLNISTPSGLIDMSNTGIPLMAVDNTGMRKLLHPYSGQHQFNGTQVTETPWLQKYAEGGEISKKWKEKTGLDWSEAKKRGLTDGSYDANISLLKKLKSNNFSLYDNSTSTPNIPINTIVNTNEVVPVTNTKYSTDYATSSDDKKREYINKALQLAENRISSNQYVDTPKSLKKIAEAQGEDANSCIGGVCTVLKDAGIIKNVNWQNTDFALHAEDYGFRKYPIRDLNKLEKGDVVQYAEHTNNTGKYFPGHARMFLGFNDDGDYRFFDNYDKKERVFSKSTLDEWFNKKNGNDEKFAQIIKINPYKEPESIVNPKAQKALAERAENKNYEILQPSIYNYSIREDAKDYNDNTKKIMNQFVEKANDNNFINELVIKTGKTKEEIHDSLLNVFGELGQENKWQDRTFSGSVLGLEGAFEKLFKPKGHSIGPGQIKFNAIPKDIMEKFNINSTKDLFNIDKLIPLMTALDLKNKDVLINWGKNNTLSDKLISKIDNENPLRAEDLKGGVGRFSPYLFNQYSSIAKGGSNQRFKLDAGSYPDKVYRATDDNLQRTIITNNLTESEINNGYYNEEGRKLLMQNALENRLSAITLQPVTINSKKKQLGGYINDWTYKYK